MKEYIILFNPSSGNGKSIKKKKRIISLLEKNKIIYDLFITKSENELRELTKTSVNKYKTIIGVGGDTTLKIIAEELFKFDEKKNTIPSLAMIGTGSVNDIMKSIGLYPLEKAITAIKNRKIDYLDIGTVKINSEKKKSYFIGSMSLGLGATVNRYVETFNKKHRIIGKTGNFGQFIAGLLGVKKSFKDSMVPQSVAIEYNNTIIKENFSLLAILNTSFYGKGIKFVNDCSPFDGKLNCAVINTNSFFETLYFYSRLEKKKKEIISFESEKIKMKFYNPIDIQLDGEILEKINELEISIIPKKLKIIIPDSMK